LERKNQFKLISLFIAIILLSLSFPTISATRSSGVWSWSNPIYVEVENDGEIEITSPYNGTPEYRHKVQLHTHTTNSDGSFRPSDVMRFHEDEDYLAVAITDHDLDRWEASLEDPGGHDIIHIPGVEYTRGYHMLGIGIENITHGGEDRRQEQIDQAREEGGMTFWAHPSTVKPIPYSAYEEYEGWDGIEIFTSNAYSLAEDHADYILTETGKRPLLIASSDTHYRVQEGGWINILSDNTPEDMDYTEVMDTLRKGEFYAVGGWPHVHSNPAEMDIYVENDTIHVETDKEADIEFITNQKNYYLEGEDHVSMERSTTSANYTVDSNDTYVRIKATVNRSRLKVLYTSMPVMVLAPVLFIILIPTKIEDKILVLYKRLGETR